MLIPTEPSSGPHLVLFSGPPGVGKSSLSYRLARQTGYALLTKDQFDRTLERLHILPDPPLSGYELMLDLAELNLRNGVSVIFEAVFPKVGYRRQALELAAACQAQFCAVVCNCSDVDLWQQRIESRGEVVRGWTPADWAEAQRSAAGYEPWTTPHLTLDAVEPFDHNYTRLLEYLHIC